MRISDWSSDVCSSDLRQIVAAAFDQDQVERRKGAVQLPYRRKVYRSVLADRRVRASAGLDAQYPLGRQRSRPGQEFGILARVDIVGDRRDVVIVAKIFAERVNQRRLSRSDRAANANARSEEHTSELQSLMGLSMSVFCWN